MQSAEGPWELWEDLGGRLACHACEVRPAIVSWACTRLFAGGKRPTWGWSAEGAWLACLLPPSSFAGIRMPTARIRCSPHPCRHLVVGYDDNTVRIMPKMIPYARNIEKMRRFNPVYVLPPMKCAAPAQLRVAFVNVQVFLAIRVLKSTPPSTK